jgi:hypothetical protein
MNYEEIRYFLFTKTYIAKDLVSHLRRLYGVPIKKGDWQKKVIKEHWDKILKTFFFKNFDYEKEKNPTERGLRLLFAINEVSKLLTPHIRRLAQILNINETLFRAFVLYNNVPKKLIGRDIIYTAWDEEPIKETGYYIKVDYNTQRQDILQAFDKIKFLYLQTGTEKSFKKKNKSLLRLRKRRDIGKNDLKKIKIFLKIEKEIGNFLKYKKIYKEDYKHEIITPAIERVVVKELKNDESKDEMKLVNQYKGYYYDVISRYNLPTVRDLKNLHDLIQSTS